MAGVGLAAGGVTVEPCVQPFAGNLADQHHRIRHRAVGSVGVRHAMQGDGRLVQIAFRIDADGVNELLVLLHALWRLGISGQKGPHRLEVEVKNAVGLRKQARGLWLSLGAKEDGHGQ